jgi:hypothetical protein
VDPDPRETDARDLLVASELVGERSGSGSGDLVGMPAFLRR